MTKMYTRNRKVGHKLSHHATLLPSQSITPNKLNIVRQQIAQAIDETQNIFKKSDTETRKKLHEKYKEHYTNRLNQSLQKQKKIYNDEYLDYTNKVKTEYKKQLDLFNTRIEDLEKELNLYKNRDALPKKRKSKPKVKKLGKRPRFESDFEETEEEDDVNEDS